MSKLKLPAYIVLVAERPQKQTGGELHHVQPASIATPSSQRLAIPDEIRLSGDEIETGHLPDKASTIRRETADILDRATIIEEAERNDIGTIKQVAALYQRVRIDPKNREDLARFSRKGGIVKPLTEEDIISLMSQPGFRLFIEKDTKGMLLAMINLFLPEAREADPKVIEETPFNAEYRKNFFPRHREAINTYLDRTAFILDAISDPDIGRGFGRHLTKYVLAQLKEAGIQIVLTEVLCFIKHQKNFPSVPYGNDASLMNVLRKLNGSIVPADQRKPIALDTEDGTIEIRRHLIQWNLGKLQNLTNTQNGNLLL